MFNRKKATTVQLSPGYMLDEPTGQFMRDWCGRAMRPDDLLALQHHKQHCTYCRTDREVALHALLIEESEGAA